MIGRPRPLLGQRAKGNSRNAKAKRKTETDLTPPPAKRQAETAALHVLVLREPHVSFRAGRIVGGTSNPNVAMIIPTNNDIIV